VFAKLGKPAIIHKKLTPLTKGQINDVNEAIRIVCKFPKRIELVYAPNMFTFASSYHPVKKKIIIIYPTVAWYFRQFPDLLKVLIQHELGHILNKDIFEETERKHARCTNITMDVRINMHLSYDHLDYANRCLFHFENKKTDLLVPETFYPKLGLPLIAGGYDWRTAHDYYHLFDAEKKKEKGDKGEKGEQGEGEGAEGEMTEEMLEELADILEDMMGGGDNPDDMDMEDEVDEQEAQEGEGKEGEGKEGEEKEGKDKEGKGKSGDKDKPLGVGDFVKVKDTGDIGVIEGKNEDGTFKVREPNADEQVKIDKMIAEKP